MGCCHLIILLMSFNVFLSRSILSMNFTYFILKKYKYIYLRYMNLFFSSFIIHLFRILQTSFHSLSNLCGTLRFPRSLRSLCHPVSFLTHFVLCLYITSFTTRKLTQGTSYLLLSLLTRKQSWCPRFGGAFHITAVQLILSFTLYLTFISLVMWYTVLSIWIL